MSKKNPRYSGCMESGAHCQSTADPGADHRAQQGCDQQAAAATKPVSAEQSCSVGRDLQRPEPPEHRQAQGINHVSRKPVPGFDHPHGKGIFSLLHPKMGFAPGPGHAASSTPRALSEELLPSHSAPVGACARHSFLNRK